VKLDPNAFLKRTGVKRLLNALDARRGTARFVGGAVRDLLLGEKPGDLDLATTLLPDEVVRRLEAAGIKAVLNFSPGTLQVPAGVKLKGVDLTVSLESLSFFLAQGDVEET